MNLLHRYKTFESENIEVYANEDTVNKLQYLKKVGAIKSYEFTKGILKIVFFNDTTAQYDYDVSLKFAKGNNTVGNDLKQMWKKYKEAAKNTTKEIDFDYLHASVEYNILTEYFQDVTTRAMDKGTVVLMHNDFKKDNNTTYDLGYKISPRGFIGRKMYGWQEQHMFVPPIFDLKGYKEAFIVIMHDLIKTDAEYSVEHPQENGTTYSQLKQLKNVDSWKSFITNVRAHLKKIGREKINRGEFTPGMWGR